MLIIDNNSTSDLLPVYEVQEVSVKEALALLKSAQGSAADSFGRQADNCLPLGAGGSPGSQVMGSSSLRDYKSRPNHKQGHWLGQSKAI